MARGKIQIKRIENQTNRQVTYSKRRNGLFKKANELTVLCDAKVSIIMISSTGKLHEFISPSVTTKQLFDLYQKTVGVDLWNSHYEKMQEQLRKLKDVNRNLRREIRQRMGESLNDLNYEQLEELNENVDNSLKLIRERKYKVIGNQIDTYKKKVRNVEEIHRNLLLEFQKAWFCHIRYSWLVAGALFTRHITSEQGSWSKDKDLKALMKLLTLQGGLETGIYC